MKIFLNYLNFWQFKFFISLAAIHAFTGYFVESRDSPARGELPKLLKLLQL
jgi:hypothetical protein